MAAKKRPGRPTNESKMRDELLALRAFVEQQSVTIAAQSERIAKLSAEKSVSRLFRKRRLEHGPLQVSIVPVEADVASSEVEIQHVGESLIILVGEAARRARDGFVPQVVHRPSDAREPQSLEIGAPADSAPLPTRRRAAMELTPAAIKTMQQMTDVSQIIQYGAQFGLDASEAAAYAIGATDMTAGLAPAELYAGTPNVVLQRQGDPRHAGGYQLDPEQDVVDGYGWRGIGQRPANWSDPDKPAPAEAGAELVS